MIRYDQISSNGLPVNKLMDENRHVRKAYSTFVVQLIESFKKRQVDPNIVKPLVHIFMMSV